MRTDAPARWRESLTFLRLTAGPTATDGAHPGCDGGATPGSHPSQPETPGILRLSAHRARTWVRRLRAQAGSHPDGKNLRNSAGFRRPSAAGRCELRTRFAAVASEISRRAPPPVSVFAKKDPDALNIKSIGSSLDFNIWPISSVVTKHLPCVVADQHDTYLHPSKRRLRIETARLRTGRAVGAHLRTWPDATCCDGQCQ